MPVRCVQCLTSARNFKKSLNKSADTVRAPDKARPGIGRFFNRTATDEKRCVFSRSTYCIYIDISLLKTKNIHFAEEAVDDYPNMQQTSAIEVFAVLSVVFITITDRVSLNLSYFNNLFLLRNDSEY